MEAEEEEAEEVAEEEEAEAEEAEAWLTKNEDFYHVGVKEEK